MNARLSDSAAKFASARERVIACCPDCWLMRVEFGLIGNLAIQAPVHLIKIQLTASLSCPWAAFAKPCVQLPAEPLTPDVGRFYLVYIKWSCLAESAS